MTQHVYRNVRLQGMTLVVVAGAWLVGILLDSYVLLPSFALLIGVAVMLVCVALLWYDSRSRLIALIMLFVVLGAWRYSGASLIGDPQAISAYIGAHAGVRGEVSDDPKLTSNSRLLSVSVNAISLDNGNTWRDAHGQITVLIHGTELDDPYGANYGSDVEIYGKVLSPLPNSLPGIAAWSSREREAIPLSARFTICGRCCRTSSCRSYRSNRQHYSSRSC